VCLKWESTSFASVMPGVHTQSNQKNTENDEEGSCTYMFLGLVSKIPIVLLKSGSVPVGRVFMKFPLKYVIH
jgi:hypothetical protein